MHMDLHVSISRLMLNYSLIVPPQVAACSKSRGAATRLLPRWRSRDARRKVQNLSRPISPHAAMLSGSAMSAEEQKFAVGEWGGTAERGRMGDYVPLPLSDGGEAGWEGEAMVRPRRAARLASLDVFRGLSITLMIIVDYASSIFPSIAHSPWNGVKLADFVMPFFLFIAGVSLALVYKEVSNKALATCKAVLRSLKLFLLGILLQGGYFHDVNSLTYGVDIAQIRWLGILQRIAIGYIVAALSEIWLSRISRTSSRVSGSGSFKDYYPQWFAIFIVSSLYIWLLYGIYVPDWQFKVKRQTSFSSADGYIMKTVKCSLRGDFGPACNSAGMIDRYLLGIDHLYERPSYRRLRECMLENRQASENSPPWCQAPFEPEGILSSLMAVVTCIIGLQFGHVLVLIEAHRNRLSHWSFLSLSLFALGILLLLIGIPLNKPLYTTSYMLITTSSAGIMFCALYLMVDVYGYRHTFFVLEWMGRHSLSIFVAVASNLAVIAIQGFYWRTPKSNIIHWIIALFVKK